MTGGQSHPHVFSGTAQDKTRQASGHVVTVACVACARESTVLVCCHATWQNLSGRFNDLLGTLSVG
ncbi:hypothetical protein Pyn_07058 [Prunus yedoensis var. nudiflora]|uniref:Uncharacterized protein n=1 Tax=Prunus yedoensis var. nudiflora TaxID=2094558 RepID=A0A314Y991_PRUYE|nr:hypothetical protein Pyn_07058 [Prunus yedoensis var. nudiflora]